MGDFERLVSMVGSAPEAVTFVRRWGDRLPRSSLAVALRRGASMAQLRQRVDRQASRRKPAHVPDVLGERLSKSDAATTAAFRRRMASAPPAIRYDDDV
ncbi:hypothetical protein [Actinomarinicola tropica]|uniref:Uncharacterized protein n=1 Tax=Actinomarinicola tropica TaxID=2789776 RepID=A0A5Q2RJY2_9ACTN|nr:hypothetical protein [Actinomarinicola tropica]QGG94357.1 hypothetical protein GH723_04145 [Actinomarinicola tropica]